MYTSWRRQEFLNEVALLDRIEDWFDKLANSEGVVASEYNSHVTRVAAEFNISEDEAARLYNKLIDKWEWEAHGYDI